MKRMIFVFTMMLSSSLSFGQLIPKGFRILTINDVDSALVILQKATTQQKVMPVFSEVTKEYFAQTWQVGKRNALTMTSRTIELPHKTYYEYITKMYVRGGWKINILNSTTSPDHLTITNKDLAEQAFAALLCLIKNSGNKNYEVILKSLESK